jgi:LPS-assembly protein
VNIRFNAIIKIITKEGVKRTLFLAFFIITAGVATLFFSSVRAAEVLIEPIQACVITRDTDLTKNVRGHIAQCLGWQPQPSFPLCSGFYRPLEIQPLNNPNEVQIFANHVSFYNQGRSKLTGNVELRQTARVLNAQTAYVYRDAKTNQVTQVELLGEVTYLEPGRLMIARKATFNPQDKSGTANDVLYRFNSMRARAVLPAWGQASSIERFPNKDYFLTKATYSNCAPQDNAWHIEADTIALDDSESTGVARHAKLYVGNVPVLYTPYLSFPTSKDRKSGFLIPTIGSTSAGGFDFSLPYYWNIAPNYDATITPHLYSSRGLMIGGQFRYLTQSSVGDFNGRFLPNDRAFSDFIQDNQRQYPVLRDLSTDRWAYQFKDITQIAPNLQFRMTLQQVSDDYFLQDFDSNMAVITERQLLREGVLTYVTDNWFFHGMLQSYQTLQPINQTPVGDIYQRLPQLLARGHYEDLPLNGQFSLLGQFDNFQWPNSLISVPEGPRYYLNPALSFPQIKPWGYITPTVELVQNYYDVDTFGRYRDLHLQRTIPRFNLDGGLFFDREVRFLNHAFTQTLEPRLFYLNVPFHDQDNIPIYDSANMIFNADQLFRTNRFSGFDRIGDANQLTYGVTTRWLAAESGVERANLTVGQIKYFKNRRVMLCQTPIGSCIESPLDLGYLSPLASTSPIAARAVYYFRPSWIATGDYVWDPATRATNNTHLDFHYQPGFNQLVGFGYTYMVNGDITQVGNSPLQSNPLHQVSFSFAWPLPFSDRWSSLGAYGYNISKQYDMMSFLGLQYDNCCWAVRLMGGRSFQSLSPNARPQYNSSVYLQVQLKGLGSVGNSDPASTIRTFVPGYVDTFRH